MLKELDTFAPEAKQDSRMNQTRFKDVFTRARALTIFAPQNASKTTTVEDLVDPSNAFLHFRL